MTRLQRFSAPDVAEFRHSGAILAAGWLGGFTKNYALACFDPRETAFCDRYPQ
jgi:hypothetical protein